MPVLSFESGGTKLGAALADDHGCLLKHLIEPRPPGQTASGTLAQLIRMGSELAEASPIDAVGFGFGGTVRRSDGRPTFCFHEEGWGDLDAVRIFADRFQVPVFIENDCNVAALAEAWSVDDPPAPSLFYVTLGTGIGGGMTTSGHLVRLGEDGEAEIGHVVVEPDGVPCPCGNCGCLEMYCSGPGLETLAKLISGHPISGKAIMEGFRKGRAQESRIAEKAADYLGRALGAAINLMAPEEVVMGGGVMSHNRAFLDLVRSRTEPFIFPPFRNRLKGFSLSRAGQAVVCRGAALYALSSLGKLV